MYGNGGDPLMSSGLDARILVVGAGALGGITTALLWERWMGGALADATRLAALTTNHVIADAVRAQGFRIGGLEPERAIKAPIVESIPAGSPRFDWIVLAVQPPQVEEAARATAEHLAPNGRVICFQNGLCEERVERIVGAGRVVGAVVSWGASMPEPGLYLRTARGGFTLGTLDDSMGASGLEDLARLLDPVAPVRITDNLKGARWSKLAINCAISTLGTIGGATLGAVMLHRVARRLALEIITESLAIARASGVKLEKIAGIDLDRLALSEEERRSSGTPSLVAKHSLILAVGARYRRMRSSMLAAIERGRIPAVDFLNGEVVDRGERLGIPTPTNREAQRMVHEIAHGRMKPGIQALHALRDRVGVSR
jgi:2-dehydropantoate 2-reductase